MKLSTKKMISLAMACALTLTSVVTGNVADAAKNTKKAEQVPSAEINIQAQKDVAATGSAVVTVASGVALSTQSALTCKYDASLNTSITEAKASVASANAVTVTVTAAKNAAAVSNAAINVFADNTTIASIKVNVKAPAVKKGTKSVGIQESVVIAAGKSKKVAYTIKKSANADQAKAVKVSSSDESVVKASKVSGKKKIQLTVPKNATKGASADVTIKSGKKTATIKVYVKNSAKTVKAAKSKVTVKKKKTKKITIKISAQNNAMPTTDSVTAVTAKKKIAVVKSVAVKEGKLVVKVKAKKKAGTTKLNVAVGSKKVVVKVKVK